MKADVAEQLRLLWLIGEEGSLAGAAEALGITGAAVTQRLTRAEAIWGVPLVERGPRGARLTPEGRTLAEHGRRIGMEAEQAVASLAEFRGEAARRLRVGAFQAAALHLLPPAMTALRHRHPDTDLSVVDILSTDALELVDTGALDLAMLASWDTPPQSSPRVAVAPLMTDPTVVVLPDDHRLALASRGSLRLSELGDEAWVVIRAGHDARSQFDQATRAAGFEPRIRFQTESYDVAQALVATGYGVALVSRLALRAWPGATHRTLAAPALHRAIHVAVPTRSPVPPLVGSFTELLRDVAADVTNGWKAAR